MADLHRPVAVLKRRLDRSADRRWLFITCLLEFTCGYLVGKVL